jgi:hypothetical protein
MAGASIPPRALTQLLPPPNPFPSPFTAALYAASPVSGGNFCKCVLANVGFGVFWSTESHVIFEQNGKLNLVCVTKQL